MRRGRYMSEAAQNERHYAMLANGEIEPGREHDANEYISPGEMAYYESVVQEQRHPRDNMFNNNDDRAAAYEEHLREQEMTDDIYDNLIDPYEPEGDDYMPDELYTDDGEIIPLTSTTDAARGLLAQLSAPFEPHLRKSRDVQGKQLWYYDYMVIQDRLNTIVPNHTIHVVNETHHDFGTTNNGYPRLLLRATVELTIPGLGTRAGAGVQVVNADSGGEDLWKGHISDGIKKAAAGFGVGKELYVDSGINQPERPTVYTDPNTGREVLQGPAGYPVRVQPPGPSVTTFRGPSTPPQIPPMPAGYNGPSANQARMIGGLQSELKITGEEMEELAISMGIDLNNLTGGRDGTASQLITQLLARKNAGPPPF